MEMLFWYVREISIRPIVSGCVVIVGLMLFGLVVGVCVNASPGSGLIFLLAYLGSFACIIVGTGHLKAVCLEKLHKVLRSIMILK